MHTKFRPAGLVVGGLVAGCMIAGGVARAADAPAGERWRQTQSTQMMGMTMPARTSEFCKEAGGDNLPIQADKNCTLHDVKRTANGATFKMSCTGKEAMEAEGEMTYLGPDHTRSTMRVKMAEGEMTMKSESQKIGPCTGAESNIQAKKMIAKAQADSAAAQAQMQQTQAKMCADAAQKAESPGMMQQCKDPATLKTYCANFQTHEPFRKQAEYEAQMAKAGVVNEQTQPLTTSAKLCGVDVKQVRERLCSTAEAQGKMAFIATQCIGLARSIAARECAGRSYTSVPERYRSICATFANPGSAGDAPAAQPPAPVEEPRKPKSGAVSKGKKILGGLLGN